MRYDSVAKEVSEKLGVPVETVLLIYKKLFLYMRDRIREMNIENIGSDEEFINGKYSFNLQHLGKLYINYNIIKRIRNSDESNRDTTDV